MKKLSITLFAILLSFTSSILAGETKVVDVSPEQVAEMIRKKNPPTIVDVRTAKEYADGHINGAILVDVTADDFEKRLAKLDRKKTYILHCRSGGRSAKALKAFKKLNFQKVYHMHEGMLAWKKTGQPTVKK